MWALELDSPSWYLISITHSMWLSLYHACDCLCTMLLCEVGIITVTYKNVERFKRTICTALRIAPVVYLYVIIMRKCIFLSHLQYYFWWYFFLLVAQRFLCIFPKPVLLFHVSKFCLFLIHKFTLNISFPVIYLGLFQLCIFC